MSMDWTSKATRTSFVAVSACSGPKKLDEALSNFPDATNFAIVEGAAVPIGEALEAPPRTSGTPATASP